MTEAQLTAGRQNRACRAKLVDKIAEWESKQFNYEAHSLIRKSVRARDHIRLLQDEVVKLDADFQAL